MDRLTAILNHPATLVALGGALGCNARYWLGRWVTSYEWGQHFPWGTFLANVTGAFFLGVLAVVLLERLTPSRRELHLLLGVGFCGGYTTFSTFQYETFQLLRMGRTGAALAYVLGSVLAGFVAVWLAVRLTEEELD
ncbi:MAG TPA: fluoride efflux transporter CrcB [Gemmataceae bacterium]